MFLSAEDCKVILSEQGTTARTAKKTKTPFFTQIAVIKISYSKQNMHNKSNHKSS